MRTERVRSIHYTVLNPHEEALRERELLQKKEEEKRFGVRDALTIALLSGLMISAFAPRGGSAVHLQYYLSILKAIGLTGLAVALNQGLKKLS